jgi:hypothetical protein
LEINFINRMARGNSANIRLRRDFGLRSQERRKPEALARKICHGAVKKTHSSLDYLMPRIHRV